MTVNHNASGSVPRHIAIIMDGNGRWATLRGQERSAGHIEGVNAVRRITTAASELGVEYLTLYTFSTENWNRPQAEVNMLMHLIVTAIERETPELKANGVRLHVIGDMSRVPDEARLRLERCIEETADGNGLHLVLAISYSARWELTRAAKKIAAQVQEGTITTDSITDSVVAANLETSWMPDPDLLIRTGGDMRISNFLLWQLAYTEIVVDSKFWPDYTKEDLQRAIDEYGTRQRRYGLTSDQLTQVTPPFIDNAKQ